MSDLFRGLRPVRIEMEERCDEHGGVIAPGTTVSKEDLIAFITAVMKEKVMTTTPISERSDAIRLANQVLGGHTDKPDIYLLCREFLRECNSHESRRRALEEAISTLELVEEMPPRDPQYHERVSALGREIGFGALMACASRAWAEEAAARGHSAGGHHVSGPSHSVVLATLRCMREALR